MLIRDIQQKGWYTSGVRRSAVYNLPQRGAVHECRINQVYDFKPWFSFVSRDLCVYAPTPGTRELSTTKRNLVSPPGLTNPP